MFGFGNPGRGDDALGPMLVEHLEESAIENLFCLADMQLQPEHVTDLADRDLVIFVDADVSCAEPFEFVEVVARKDDSYTSHAMSPAALLHAYLLVYKSAPPQAYLLRIRGYQFELGEMLSDRAAENMRAAIRYMGEFADRKAALGV
jgi:hydrogenase maturation protease